MMAVPGELAVERAGAADVADLAALLVGAVTGGASLEFVAPLEADVAAGWWRARLTGPANVVWLARLGGRAVGTVTLALAAQHNAAHRAEVKKLIVAGDARRRGIASRMMTVLEADARARGRTLLFLDTEQGSGAEAFYRRAGYTEAGVIPGFAMGARGDALVATVLFYKRLAG